MEPLLEFLREDLTRRLSSTAVLMATTADLLTALQTVAGENRPAGFEAAVEELTSARDELLGQVGRLAAR